MFYYELNLKLICLVFDNSLKFQNLIFIKLSSLSNKQKHLDFEIQV